MSFLPSERRALVTISGLYASRMLGLFMVLPVLSLFVGELEGMDYVAVGLALGIYGLTQGLLQIPFGMLSDRIGRKAVLIIGLCLFLAGSVIAYLAESATTLIIGRALQGSGAIAGVLLALLAELTTEQNRSKAMAAIGASIGASFAIAMIFGPLLSGTFGLKSVFLASIILALGALLLALFRVPTIQNRVAQSQSADVKPVWRFLPEVLTNRSLQRLNISIFALHFIQMSMWVAVPVLLETSFNLERADHPWFYLIVVGGSFFSMLPLMIYSERKRRVRALFLAAIGLVFVAQLIAYQAQIYLLFLFAMYLFFFGFNLQEAKLPALVSRLGPAGAKGTAMSVYSTFQFLGVFFGGMLGGLLVNAYGLKVVFILNAVVALVWFLLSLAMKEPANMKSFPIRLQADEQQILDQLRALRGVVDITLIEEYGEAFLRADMDQFDIQAAEQLIGRPL